MNLEDFTKALKLFENTEAKKRKTKFEQSNLSYQQFIERGLSAGVLTKDSLGRIKIVRVSWDVATRKVKI